MMSEGLDNGVVQTFLTMGPPQGIVSRELITEDVARIESRFLKGYFGEQGETIQGFWKAHVRGVGYFVQDQLVPGNDSLSGVLAGRWTDHADDGLFVRVAFSDSGSDDGLLIENRLALVQQGVSVVNQVIWAYEWRQDESGGLIIPCDAKLSLVALARAQYLMTALNAQLRASG